jgi:hypothetical protein
MPNVRRIDWYAFLIYVSVAVSLGFTDHRVRRFAEYVVTEYIPAVVGGHADAPARYRVLAPFLLDAAIRASGGHAMLVFLALRLAVIYAALVVTHLYLRRWYTGGTAFAGTVLLAALLPLTFTNSWAHPDSMVELALFAAACWAIAGGREAWFLGLLIVASLNRETSGFLLVLYAWNRLAASRSMPTLARVAANAGVWLAIFVGLRWLRGFVHYSYWMLPANVASIVPLPANFDPYVRISGFMWLVLTLPLLGLAVSGARRAGWSSFMAQSVGVGVFLLVVGFLISSVIESRIFVPLLPLLLPAALAGMGTGVIPDAAAESHPLANP